jgi:hypothetical protein
MIATNDIGDLLAGKTTRRSVKDRIEQRVALLRNWIRDGVPAEVELPSSLAELRRWCDEGIGVERIASPNEFTKTHPIHGPLVTEAERLLRTLLRRYERPVGKRPSTDRSAELAAARETQHALTRAVSQWHAERDANSQLRKRAEAAVALSEVLRRENAEKDALISDLTRQISIASGMRVVS